MLRASKRAGVVLFAAWAALRVTSAAAPGDVDKAFAAYWSAANPRQAEMAADGVVKSGVSFDEAFARLRRGKTYSTDVSRGVVRLTHRLSGTSFAYQLEIPQTYDPGRAYQVRIQLHGGVSRPDPSPRGNGIGALAGAEQIYILPTAWDEAPWWNDIQVENLRMIVDSVKRTYNVDENRIAVAGVSDGATATYYFAMRDTTPYSSFLPLNGALAVLTNTSNGIQGELYANNLLNKPFFIINGGQDPLYPMTFVEPYINHLKQNGVEVMYVPQPNSKHNTSWWPEMREPFEKFVRDHPRKPYPEKLTWETDLSAGTSRAHWLVIDELAKTQKSEPLPDLNNFQMPGLTRTAILPLFSHHRPSGRVDIVREGNMLKATTRGVKAFTVLLSPDVFDLSRPVKVVADGRTVFDGPVRRDVASLMKWAARDNDRTMLFGAEVHVALAP